MRRKSDVPRIKSQRFIIQVSHLLCYFRLISNINCILIINGTRKQCNFANSVPIFNAGVRLNLARRRKRLTTNIATWARVKSPWVLHFNSGACNGCDIEVIALLTPRYDVERFGIKLEPSPRHADVLLTTGVVTRQCAERLKRIYDQMPEPKFVVAIGACACSGGVFKGNYTVEGGVDKIIPVDVYIPGCPPKPEAIIDGIVKLLSLVKEAKPNGN